MDSEKIRAELTSLLADKTLFEETRLDERRKALASIAYLGQVLQRRGWQGEFAALFQQVLAVQEQLRAVDAHLFQQLRADLVTGNYTPDGLRARFGQFTRYNPHQRGQPDYEYDGLDLLLEQVILPTQFPNQSRERTPSMIRYEATPARLVLELIDSLHFTAQDILVDLGSGLGLVAILVNLLTGIPALGIEYDPAYCAYAQARAAELGLTKVTFINADARQADFSQGTIFYLFTPFINEIFDEVLEKLRLQARRRMLYICSYGTCTFELVKLPWLQIRDPALEHDFKLAIFTSSL